MKHQPAITVERYVPQLVGRKKRWDCQFGYASREEAQAVLETKIDHWRIRGWSIMHSRLVTIRVQV